MSASPVKLPDCETHTAELLAAAGALFADAVQGKPITSADRDQIAYKFQKLLDDYMRFEYRHVIGTFFDSLYIKIINRIGDNKLPIVAISIGEVRLNEIMTSTNSSIKYVFR